VLQHAPLYALHEWAGSFDAALLGLTPAERALLNDDRVGRVLERLFHADRGSFLTHLVLGAVHAFDVDLSRTPSSASTCRGTAPSRSPGRRIIIPGASTLTCRISMPPSSCTSTESQPQSPPAFPGVAGVSSRSTSQQSLHTRKTRRRCETTSSAAESTSRLSYLIPVDSV
jgi:hypothetical protein